MKNLGYLTLALALAIGCQKPTEDASKTIENSTDAPQESQSLVIYSGRSQVLVGGLVEAFEKSTGIKVDVRYEKSTQTLANRIATEAKRPKQTLLRSRFRLPRRTRNQRAPKASLGRYHVACPENHRDKEGRWLRPVVELGFLCMTPNRLLQELPTSLKALGTKWKGSSDGPW